MHQTLRCKLIGYFVHACMDIALNVMNLEMHGAWGRPGRLLRAQVSMVRRVGGVGARTHSVHSHQLD